MRFRKIDSTAHFLIGSAELRIEQLRQVALAGFALVGALGPGILIEIEDVTVELERRQPRAIQLGPLDVAIEHDQARALLGLRENAGLREVGDRSRRFAVVVHQDALDLPPRRKLADKDRQSIARSGERTFAQYRSADVRSDVKN